MSITAITNSKISDFEHKLLIIHVKIQTKINVFNFKVTH